MVAVHCLDAQSTLHQPAAAVRTLREGHRIVLDAAALLAGALINLNA
jgi:hypothetical protein